MVSSCLVSIIVHLPKFGSLKSTKTKSDDLETPAISMPEQHDILLRMGAWAEVGWHDVAR